MKKMLLSIVGLVALMTVLAGCNTSKLQTIGADQYFVQITDGGKEIETGYEPRYEYAITGYDKKGNDQELVFTAGHQLTEGAFIKVYYKDKNEEVIYYEEVEKDDIPEKAYEQLQ